MTLYYLLSSAINAHRRASRRYVHVDTYNTLENALQLQLHLHEPPWPVLRKLGRGSFHPVWPQN